MKERAATESKDELNIGSALVIIVSSTNLICRRTFPIWLHWVIAAKSIASSNPEASVDSKL